MLLVVAFSLLMSDFFDTMGTAMAVAKQGEFLTEDGNVEDIRPILVVDSVAAAAGGFMGVSSIPTFVESTSGAADGGRTGLTSVTTGVVVHPRRVLLPRRLHRFQCRHLRRPGLRRLPHDERGLRDRLVRRVAGLPGVHDCRRRAPSPTPSLPVLAWALIAYVVVALFKGEASKIKPLMWIAALAFLVYFFVA